jgi:N-dimethylarginine dimethylaminohydrolase
MYPLHLLPIAYLHLPGMVSILDANQPVYVAPLVESAAGTTPGQQTDHHYIMVTQPDALNRVHYCRILVVRLVYHNGIAFAPDYAEQLAKVEEVRGEVEAWLVGEGYEVRAGMVALPEGMMLLEGVFQEVENS